MEFGNYPICGANLLSYIEKAKPPIMASKKAGTKKAESNAMELKTQEVNEADLEEELEKELKEEQGEDQEEIVMKADEGIEYSDV